MSLPMRHGGLLDASAATASGRVAAGWPAWAAGLGLLNSLDGSYSAGSGAGFMAIAKLGIEKQIPAGDFIFGEGRIRQDSRNILAVFQAQVKHSGYSKHSRNYYCPCADAKSEQASWPEPEGGRKVVKS